MVARYDINANAVRDESGPHMSSYPGHEAWVGKLDVHEHPQGDWVKYSDYEKLLERFERLETMFLEMNEQY